MRGLGVAEKLVLLLGHLLPTAFALIAWQRAHKREQGVNALPETMSCRQGPSLASAGPEGMRWESGSRPVL